MTLVPLLPEAARLALRANAATGDDGADPVPVVKLFNPIGPGRWLLTELLPDDDTLFGLCELCTPELGYVSLSELLSIRLPLGLRIERDASFVGRVPLSMWVRLAARLGSIQAAEGMVRLMAADGGKPS